MILLVDYETTGLDPQHDRITEIGAMLVDEEFTKVASVSTLVWGDGYPILTDEVSKLTGITMEDIKAHAVTPLQGLQALAALVDYRLREVIAFNSQFDESFLRAELDRQGMQLHPQLQYVMSRPWLCAMEDLETNYQYKSWRLAHLALEYGIAVDPATLHRAIGDVELMRKVLKQANATIDGMRAFKESPWVYLKAQVRKPWEDGGVSTGAAKKLGYSFERARGDNTGKEFKTTWVKRVKEKFLEQELQPNGAFKVVLV